MIGTTPFYFADATVAELTGAPPRIISGQSTSVWRRRRARAARRAARAR